MNKKVALVTLIEASMMLSDEDKLALIDRVPAFTDWQVDALGKVLATERQFVLDHEQDFRNNLNVLLAELEQPEQDTVYVGSGKSE